MTLSITYLKGKKLDLDAAINEYFHGNNINEAKPE